MRRLGSPSWAHLHGHEHAGHPFRFGHTGPQLGFPQHGVAHRGSRNFVRDDARETFQESPRKANALEIAQGETFDSGEVTGYAESDTDNEFSEWLESADSGELDFYSVYALAIGRLGWKSKFTCQLSRYFVVVMFMQGILPALVFAYFAQQHQEPTEHGLEFRIIGLGLYLYAEYEMWESACDECRSQLLAMCTKYNLPSSYTGALIVGELTNAFTGFNLTVCLFFIFSTSATPVDLILNSLAINFLLQLDNDMIDEEVKKKTMELFEDLQTELEENNLQPLSLETFGDKVRNRCNNALLTFFMVSRFLLILLLGVIFAIAFFLRAEDRICSFVGSVADYLPFCVVDEF